MRSIKSLMCFECEKRTQRIHWHHVIPYSLGGTKCIPLCEECHGIIHGHNLRISSLIKNGLKKAKERGVALGRPVGYVISEEEFLQKHEDIVEYLKNGFSVRKVAKLTNKGNSTVQRIKKVMKKNGDI